MVFYCYLPTTFEYVGTRTVTADWRTGAISAPAHSTHVQPPAAGEHQVAVYNETLAVWSLEADWRDVPLWDIATGMPVHITQIGQTPDATMTTDQTKAGIKSPTDQAKSALALSDVSDMGRVSEDLIDTLVTKGVIALTDLPQAAQTKLAARKAQRATITAAATSASTASTTSNASTSTSATAGASS